MNRNFGMIRTIPLLPLISPKRIRGRQTNIIGLWRISPYSKSHSSNGLAYTVKVTEKCDVYSFEVLVLEVTKGKHLGDPILSLSSPLTRDNMLVKDVLDQRIPIPPPEFQDGVLKFLNIAIACLRANPQSRPTMNMIIALFSA
ncbi:hypothetical protein ACOSQ4_013990 [Xanthoceras sorbifolium]